MAKVMATHQGLVRRQDDGGHRGDRLIARGRRNGGRERGGDGAVWEITDQIR